MQVERIAVCYWRLRRCLRAEVGEIRKALDSCWLTREQGRVEAIRSAKMLSSQLDSQRTLRQDSVGLNYLIQLWQGARQELAERGCLSAPVSDLLRRTLPQAKYVQWDNREAALAFIDHEISRLLAIRGMYQEKEVLELEALKLSLTLPSKEAVEKNLRYETTISHQMYKAMAELERLQRMRKGEPVKSAKKQGHG